MELSKWAIVVVIVIVLIFLWRLAASGWLRAAVLTVTKGITLRIEGLPREERWVPVVTRDIKKGDTQNTKQQCIPVTLLRRWRIKFGTRPLPKEEDGHFTVRVYGDWGRLIGLKPVRNRKRIMEVVDLHEPSLTRSAWIHVQKRGLLIIQVAPKTVWWTLEVQQPV